MKRETKILFICKLRPATYGASYGLLNSCRFLCNALNSMGVEAHVVEVIDNNFIDAVVHKYRPTHVFIEALWVVPEKFDVLVPLHPRVEWHVRLHSNTPFLANEGMAIEWIRKYDLLQKKYFNFHIAPNAIEMGGDLRKSLNISTIYAPNIYQPHKNITPYHHNTPIDRHPERIDIGCFGAIRPLKNQLIQAMAAMTFANEQKKKLRFHINHTRIEGNGDNAYKNLKSLFEGGPHELVEHGWMLHHEFLELVRSMDLGLQVSFSETFNIVCADFTHVSIPIVGSKEVKWMSSFYQADTNDLDSIVSHLWLAWIGKPFNLHRANQWGLDEWNLEARKVWKNLLNI